MAKLPNRGFLSPLIYQPDARKADFLRETIGKKFQAWSTELLKEDFIDRMHLLPAERKKLIVDVEKQKRSFFTARINEMKKQGYFQEMPDEEIRKLYDNKFSRLLVKESYKTAQREADERVVQNFMRWLNGEGTSEELKRTPWGRIKVAYEIPEVRAWISSFIDIMHDTKLKLFKLVWKGPKTLNDYWIYYKYVIHAENWDESDPFYFTFIAQEFYKVSDTDGSNNFLTEGEFFKDGPDEKYNKDKTDPRQVPDLYQNLDMEAWETVKDKMSKLPKSAALRVFSASVDETNYTEAFDRLRGGFAKLEQHEKGAVVLTPKELADLRLEMYTSYSLTRDLGYKLSKPVPRELELYEKSSVAVLTPALYAEFKEREKAGVTLDPKTIEQIKEYEEAEAAKTAAEEKLKADRDAAVAAKYAELKKKEEDETAVKQHTRQIEETKQLAETVDKAVGAVPMTVEIEASIKKLEDAKLELEDAKYIPQDEIIGEYDKKVSEINSEVKKIDDEIKKTKKNESMLSRVKTDLDNRKRELKRYIKVSKTRIRELEAVEGKSSRVAEYEKRLTDTEAEYAGVKNMSVTVDTKLEDTRQYDRDLQTYKSGYEVLKGTLTEKYNDAVEFETAAKDINVKAAKFEETYEESKKKIADELTALMTGYTGKKYEDIRKDVKSLLGYGKTIDDEFESFKSADPASRDPLEMKARIEEYKKRINENLGDIKAAKAAAQKMYDTWTPNVNIFEAIMRRGAETLNAAKTLWGESSSEYKKMEAIYTRKKGDYESSSAEMIKTKDIITSLSKREERLKEQLKTANVREKNLGALYTGATFSPEALVLSTRYKAGFKDLRDAIAGKPLEEQNKMIQDWTAKMKKKAEEEDVALYSIPKPVPISKPGADPNIISVGKSPVGLRSAKLFIRDRNSPINGAEYNTKAFKGLPYAVPDAYNVKTIEKKTVKDALSTASWYDRYGNALSKKDLETLKNNIIADIKDAPEPKEDPDGVMDLEQFRKYLSFPSVRNIGNFGVKEHLNLDAWNGENRRKLMIGLDLVFGMKGFGHQIFDSSSSYNAAHKTTAPEKYWGPKRREFNLQYQAKILQLLRDELSKKKFE